MITRPLMRYHGGKWELARWILSYFPQEYWNLSYTEVFACAGSVFFQKRRSKLEVLNDLSGEIFNLYYVIRNRHSNKELFDQLNLTPYSLREYEVSIIDDESIDPVERARRTIIRHWFSVNSSERLVSGFRKNYDNKTRPCVQWNNWKSCFSKYSTRLQGVHIDNRPAVDVIKGFDRSDVIHYVDPPYVYDTRGSHAGRAYTHEMDDDEHRILAHVLNSLEGMVILSGYPSKLYEELFPDWTIIKKRSRVDRGTKKTECLWLNPALQKARGIQLLFPQS